MKIRFILLFIFLTISFFQLNAQTVPDSLQTKIPESYIADIEKPIMVMFTASWCSPCHYMKNTIFKDKHVATVLQKLNVLVYDIDTTEGAAFYIAMNGKQGGIPTFILMNKEQKIIAKSRGSMNSRNFIKFLNQAL